MSLTYFNNLTTTPLLRKTNFRVHGKWKTLLRTLSHMSACHSSSLIRPFLHWGSLFCEGRQSFYLLFTRTYRQQKWSASNTVHSQSIMRTQTFPARLMHSDVERLHKFIYISSLSHALWHLRFWRWCLRQLQCSVMCRTPPPPHLPV
jgi:hypothetical protein